MRLLALDTCDPRGSVALLRDQSVLHVESHETPEDYSCWLLPAVSRALATAGLALRDLDLYAVAVGPGSFTGVRVGLATVKAWGELYSRPIAAVSRLEALAEENIGHAPYVSALFDARRNQIFAALYHRARQLTRIDEEMVIAPEKFVDWCASITAAERIDWVSTDAHCLTQTQNWSSRAVAKETVQEVSGPLAPRIGQIGLRLAQQNRLRDSLHLDANYVRRSDAEIFWKGASNHGA